MSAQSNNNGFISSAIYAKQGDTSKVQRGGDMESQEEGEEVPNFEFIPEIFPVTGSGPHLPDNSKNTVTSVHYHLLRRSAAAAIWCVSVCVCLFCLFAFRVLAQCEACDFTF